MNNNEKKELVKHRYNELALYGDSTVIKRCCATSPKGPSIKVFTMNEDYSNLKGYEAEADLGFGCGIPTQYADIILGDTVVDLGSGAGNDCFIARSVVGENGQVIGIDFSPQMVERARKNANRQGYTNVKFIEADIEHIPLPDAVADVVVSNCVLNLLPEKNIIFKEIFRILKTGGHFCISDVMLKGFFPKDFIDNAAMYAACISSATQMDEYMEEIVKADFKSITIDKTKKIEIPDDVLEEHLSKEAIAEYNTGNMGVYSITVTGMK